MSAEHSPNIDDVRKALEVSRSCFQAIVDRNPDGILVLTTEGIIAFANPTAQVLLGRKNNELLGQPFGIPLVPGDTTEINILRRGGSPRVAEMRVVNTKWQSRPAYLATLRDISEHKHAAQMAKNAVKLRDEFLAMLSHELRNPLAAIVNAATILKKTDNHSPILDSARTIISRQCAQMTRLLDDLLDLSRMSQGKIRLDEQRVNLTRLLKEAAESFAPLMKEQGQKFHLDLPDQPVRMIGDSTRLTQVINNLLTNSSKYTPRGGTISLTLTIDVDEALIIVRDSGVGIEPDMLESIFEPFVQASRTLSSSDGGLGVGLSLVRKLVELHKGSIEAFSEGFDKGSEFHLRFPLLVDSGYGTDFEIDLLGSDGKLRIVVVEDNDDVRAMMQTLLELDGHVVFTASDGGEAVELIQEKLPHVALVDIGLPTLNGYQLAEILRKDERCGKVTLVALTGYGQPEDLRRATQAGFDAHIVKPVDYKRLTLFLSRLADKQSLGSGSSSELPATN